MSSQLEPSIVDNNFNQVELKHWFNCLSSIVDEFHLDYLIDLMLQ